MKLYVYTKDNRRLPLANLPLSNVVDVHILHLAAFLEHQITELDVKYYLAIKQDDKLLQPFIIATDRVLLKSPIPFFNPIDGTNNPMKRISRL